VTVLAVAVLYGALAGEAVTARFIELQRTTLSRLVDLVGESLAIPSVASSPWPRAQTGSLPEPMNSTT